VKRFTLEVALISLPLSLLVAALLADNANPGTITAGLVTETFADATHYDYASSTGTWNIVSLAAQARRVANTDAARPLDFGDGSDGELVQSSGSFTFDTDSHPNGYNFTSVNVTGGTLTVTGSNPLKIKCLSTFSISNSVELSVKGTNGASGAINPTTAGGAGGTSLTCGGNSRGGNGGAADSANGYASTDGTNYDGTVSAASVAGNSGGASATVGNAATGSPAGPGNFETGSNFVCGGGGGGGGGHQTNAGAWSTGGGGGAGGGLARIVAIGNVSFFSINAAGGNGGGAINDGTACGGHGSGGNGGAVWVQTLGTITATTPPNDIATYSSLGGSGGGCAGTGNAGFEPVARGDSSAGAGLTWSVAGYTTANVVVSDTSVVVSKGYDLGTADAGFFVAPTATTTLNGGTIDLAYSGSSNNSSWSDWVTDITQLSDRGFRYVRFKATITPGTTTSPALTGLTIPFVELHVRLNGGCGSLLDISGNDRGGTDGSGGNLIGAATYSLWIILFLMIRLYTKRRWTIRRAS